MSCVENVVKKYDIKFTTKTYEWKWEIWWTTEIFDWQEQLENKLSREGGRLSGVEVIIQQHSSQVDQLNDQLQRAREQQESLIKERIKAKKHQKEM